MHVADAGRAIAALCDSPVTGAINIGSGQPVTLAEVALEIGRQLARPDLLAMGALPTRPEDPPVLTADTRKLTFEVGFNPRYDLTDGLADAIAFWRTHRVP
jgi:nucleoside-diphosphate-sugar epimerase